MFLEAGLHKCKYISKAVQIHDIILVNSTKLHVKKLIGTMVTLLSDVDTYTK